MNQMHGIQQPGGVGGGIPQAMGISPGMMQQSPQQMQAVMQHQPQQPPPPEKMDNISKVKSLIGPLRESLSVNFLIVLFVHKYCLTKQKLLFILQTTLKISAQLLQHNNFTDNGNMYVSSLFLFYEHLNSDFI